MNNLKEIIETVITKEIEQDKGVCNDGYVLAPVYLSTALKGDGKPEEVTTSYQLDFFFRSKGELISKAKSLIDALKDYPTNDLTFTWEETARLWRATVSIETI